jgi:HSP20 family protein
VPALTGIIFLFNATVKTTSNNLKILLTMTQLTKRRNGNGGLFPSLANDFFTDRFLTPRLFGFEGDFLNESMTVPPVNIEETDKEFKVDLCVPGMKRDDFKVDVENGTLNISSEKEEEKKEDDKNYKRREYYYNKFSRTFQLPENIDENNINAKYDNGVLQITIPKKEVKDAKPKKEIKVG